VRNDERIRDALADMVAYCDTATGLVGAGRDRFLGDRVSQLASEALLNRIGDTARNRLPEQFREEHPEVPWPLIIGMRVIVAHLYHDIDYTIVWETLEHDLPRLSMQLQRLLAENGS
jgi:uncharacterized protein with HEPN domain